MKEHPILFSAPMVLALLAGRKTQTRRVVAYKPAPKVIFPLLGRDSNPTGEWFFTDPVYERVGHSGHFCPYGQPGDRLWVREACWMWGKWTPNGTTGTGRKKWKFVRVGTGLRYQENQPTVNAKRDGECGWVYRHARYAPKSASRITLEITDVRVQRLQEISEEDAQAEGIDYPGTQPGPIAEYSQLWDSINAKRGFGWDVNPWVWALTFKAVA